MAAALVECVVTPKTWRHRRVDSVVLTGDEGRFRTSVDCTVPVDGRLRWGGPDGNQLVVPIGMFKKEPLRGFDATDDGGRPLPMLGKRDSARLAADMVLFSLLDVDGVEWSERLSEAVYVIAEGGDPQAEVEELLKSGRFNGEAAIPPGNPRHSVARTRRLRLVPSGASPSSRSRV